MVFYFVTRGDLLIFGNRGGDPGLSRRRTPLRGAVRLLCRGRVWLRNRQGLQPGIEGINDIKIRACHRMGNPKG